MTVHMSYRVHKTPDLEKETNHLIEKLSKRLQVFRPELVRLKGAIEESSARKLPTVSLNLRLPSGQFAVEKSADTAVAAIKAAGEDLLLQVGKHKELLRNSHKWRGRRRPAANRHESQVPFETTLAAVQPLTISSEDIRGYVNANLGRLERYVEREIYFLEASDQISCNSISRQEVVDETIARALGEDGEKPERLALEPWLFRIALGVVREAALTASEDDSAIHLEQRLPKKHERASDEPQLQFHQPDESFTEETIIPDRRAANPEDAVYSDEMMTLLQYAVAGASRTDREAFILHAIEGFMLDEVAVITDRKADDVLSSINAVRERLRRSPPLANRFREKALPMTAAD